MMESAAGSAPDLNSKASLFTSSWLKFPVIWPRPPGDLRTRITGADFT